jgi:hypothetical protein
MKKSFVSLLAFAAISLSAGIASASQYICSAIYLPGSNSYFGSYGDYYISIYTGADCTGSFVGGYYFCSSGATATLCSSSSDYRGTSGDQMAIMASKAIDAAQWNLPVWVATVSCIGGGGSCGGYVTFY